MTRAASGRIARCVLTWSGDPLIALEAACGTVGALVNPGVLSAALSGTLQEPGREGFIVAIRRDDRERFEETVAGVHARWIGETTALPGLGLSGPDHPAP